MRNRLFDEHVRKQFEHWHPKVPSRIWENIKQKQETKPAPFAWVTALRYGAAAALFLLIAGGAIYLTMQSSRHSAGSASFKPEIPADTYTTKAISSNNIPAATNGAVSANDANTGASAPGNRNVYSTKAQTEISINQSFPEFNLVDLSANDITALARSTRNFDLLKQDADGKKIIEVKKQFANIGFPEIEKNAAGDKRYFELYIGPDHIFNQYTEQSHSSYAEKRKASVTPLYAYSAGARYTKVFKNGVSVRTGINYSQVNESFSNTRQTVSNQYVVQNGDTSGSYFVAANQSMTGTNIYRTIDIPVTAGYEFGNGKLHTNINTGVVLNVATKQSGFVVDEAGNPVNISSNKSASRYSFKSNAGVSLVGAVSVYYKVSNKVHILAEPYVRYGLQPVTKSDLSFAQKNHAAGLRVGLRMDLK